MTQWASYLNRSTGIVAGILAVAALVWGFLFSARETGTRRRPNWWLDLHNWLGGAALVFTIAHIAMSLADRDTGLGLLDVFVPGVASADRLALAWGVVATYLFAVTVLTSWPRRMFSRRTWRIIHLSSVIGVALVVAHALQMGSDMTGWGARVPTLLLVAMATYALGVRVFGVLARRRA